MINLDTSPSALSGLRLIELMDHLALENSIVGGKFSSQARLAQANFPIPEAFCIAADSVDDIRKDIDHVSLLATSNSDMYYFAPTIAALISHRAHRLKWPLAIRSSATVEDSAESSYAGIFESILGISDDEELFRAIVRCWKSAFEPRVALYATTVREGSSPARIGIICQELVNAHCGGVIFTRDPVDGSPNLSIEGAWGLPSVVVGGQVTPDRVDISRTGQIIKRRLGYKVIVTEYTHGRVLTRRASPVEESTFCLSNEQLEVLFTTALEIEELFGAPQDIEWAFDADQLFILQSRPITTLKRDH